MDFAIGGFAAVCAGFFTNPLDVMKTRMQLQGELMARGNHAVHYKNVLHAGYVIAKHDGLLALQAGLVPALWFQLVLNGWRFGVYQVVDDRGWMRDTSGNMVMYKNIVVSGVAGGSSAVIASPFYLINTHLKSQASKEIAFGHQYHYKGTWSALAGIYREQGVRGLFRGSVSGIPRLVVGSTSQLSSFAYCKEVMKKHDILQNSPLLNTFTASMVGGVAVALMMTPFDLVATRLYNQGVDEKGRGLLYRGYTDCVVKIWKSEGFLGFYKGLGPSYFRLGPHTVLCLVFWDQFKDMYGSFKRKNGEPI